MSAPADSPQVVARFEAELPLVDIIARQIGRTAGRSVDLDELVSFGREGLLDAARKFDPDRGVPFRAYANFRVRGAILDGVRSLGRLPRRAFERLRALEAAWSVSEGAAEDVLAAAPRGASRGLDAEASLDGHLASMATAMAMSLMRDSAAVPSDPIATPEQLALEAERLSLLQEHIDSLPHAEKELVKRHYFQGERFDHVAAELGLSKSWASRLHTRAVARLTKLMKD